MTSEIFKNYDAFYNMLISVTIMSNAQTDELERDGKKIIDFIGKAYRLEKKFIDLCTDVILEQLTPLALISEQQAIYKMRKVGEPFSPSAVLLDIKGEVLNTIQNIGRDHDTVNRSWFDYTHYKTYEPHVRYSKLSTTSSIGDITATRQVGILKALGIGCDKDLSEAKKRLYQCVMWGDIPSMYLLSHCYKLSRDKENEELFYQVALLCEKYLNAGVTVLPEEATKRYSDSACTYFVYISTILQDVIIAYNKKRIDFSFIEAISTPSLDYFDKMNFINNYDRKEWKNITNSSAKPSKYGF